MRIEIIVLGGFLASALAACSPPAAQAPTASEASVSAPATSGAPAGGLGVQPGTWRTTVTVLEINAPGIPAGAAAQMKAKPIVDEDCSTSEDVKDFAGKHAMEDGDGMTCTANTITAAGGKLSGQSTCKDNDGVEHTSVVEGTYSTTHVDLNLAISATTPAGPMTQKVHLVSDRIGECKS